MLSEVLGEKEQSMTKYSSVDVARKLMKGKAKLGLSDGDTSAMLEHWTLVLDLLPPENE